MIGAARYELHILGRNRASLWSLLCLAVLVLLAFSNIALETRRADLEKSEIAAAERARWLGQGTKDPHSAAHYSIFVFKPSPALAALDPGIVPFVGQSVWLEAHHQNDLAYRPQQTGSLLQRAGLASPAGLIIGFSPLIIFLLAFTLVAQDRERGTLRLALGAVRKPATLAGAKVGAIWIATAGFLVLPVSLLAVILGGGQGTLDADMLARILFWGGGMVVYLGILTAFGVAIGLWARNARTALVVLAGIWIAFALVMPRAASAFADAARPLPSSQALRQEMLDEAPAYWSAEAGAEQKAQLLERYNVTSLEQIPNPRMAELDLVERHSHQVFDRVLGGLYDRVAAQDRLYSLFAVLSPAVAAQSLSAGLAGTDFSQHRHFIQAAEKYRRDLVNRMNADGMAHEAHGAERHTNDIRLWSQIPEFSYSHPALVQAGQSVVPALLLPLWLGSAFVTLLFVARRLKP